jgi:hypothetical protein
MDRNPTPMRPHLDRPATQVPRVDAPCEGDANARIHPPSARSGDRSTHRAHHALFEDLLN